MSLISTTVWMGALARKSNAAVTEPRIVTVTGTAFFDINHAPADQSNRRTDLQGYAAWEIHPVMKIELSN